jgi:hypothetical protein
MIASVPRPPLSSTPSGGSEVLKYRSAPNSGMRRLVIAGDPGIRKDAVIEYDGEELVCFQVTRNGDWHGPEEVQLWCVAGSEDEREDFDRRNYVPHFLDVERVEAGAVDVLKAKGDLAV